MDGPNSLQENLQLAAPLSNQPFEAVSQFGFGHNPLFDAGLAAHETGRPKDAISKFLACLESDPDPSTRERSKSYLAAGYARLARAAIILNDLEHALDLLDEAVSYRPYFADIRLMRAMIFDRLGRNEDRAFEIMFALDFNPKYSAAILQKGILEIEFGDAGSGESLVRKAVESNSRIDVDACETALAALARGDKAMCIKLLKDPGIVQDRDKSTLVREGDTLAHEGQWSRAEEAYRRALDEVPRFADVLCKHGRVLMQLGRNEEAVAQLRESVEVNPKYADGYAFLGLALQNAGYPEKAGEAFAAALAIDPGHVVALKRA